MTDVEIQTTTGISFGTFHRWSRGDIGPTGPQPAKVRQFYDRLGRSHTPAFNALGWTDHDRIDPDPEPELPPDVRTILRKLRDPNVPDSEKTYLFESLKDLAARPVPPKGPRKK